MDKRKKETTETISAEMIEAAMKQLGTYEVASEYVDREMMREILRAALSSRVKRAS
jgi:hypothetical protein